MWAQSKKGIFYWHIKLSPTKSRDRFDPESETDNAFCRRCPHTPCQTLIGTPIVLRFLISFALKMTISSRDWRAVVLRAVSSGDPVSNPGTPACTQPPPRTRAPIFLNVITTQVCALNRSRQLTPTSRSTAAAPCNSPAHAASPTNLTLPYLSILFEAASPAAATAPPLRVFIKKLLEKPSAKLIVNGSCSLSVSLISCFLAGVLVFERRGIFPGV